VTHRDLRLLSAAALTTAIVRVGLWVLPFRVVRNSVARFAQPARDACANQQPLERVVWAVNVASRVVPHATCLTQSLAAQILLARDGYPADLHLGVARAGAHFEAHAWVECNGRVVIGNVDVGRYTPVITSATRSEF
jgi:hypothetical protein